MIPKKRVWIAGFAAAVLFAVAQTTNLGPRFPGVPWLERFLVEVPVWLSLLAISPLVIRISRHCPFPSRKPWVPFFAQLAAAPLILTLMFLIVETVRTFISAPLSHALGLMSSPPAISYMALAEDHAIVRQALLDVRFYGSFFIFPYSAIIILYYSMRYYQELMLERIKARELEALLARSQLDALRLQLQPHFLFNTLNTVSSLMSRDVFLARRMLARLSDLLRHSLSDFDKHETELRSELDFLDAYLEIQTARFGDRLVIRKEIEPDILCALVPPMLLQPLVENAIRHGMRDGDEQIVIRVIGKRESGKVVLIVSDDGNGAEGEDIIEGVGLRNTRERLEQLYGTDFELDAKSVEPHGFQVVVSIPKRTAAPVHHLMETKSAIA